MILKTRHWCTSHQCLYFFCPLLTKYFNFFLCYTFKNVCLENKKRELDDETTKVIFNSNAYEKEKDVAIKAF